MARQIDAGLLTCEACLAMDAAFVGAVPGITVPMSLEKK